MGLQFALAYGEEIVLKCHISTPRYWLPSCECIVVSLDRRSFAGRCCKGKLSQHAFPYLTCEGAPPPTAFGRNCFGANSPLDSFLTLQRS
jgi:hypothetical protein